jgi:hypothetical protein
MLDQLYGIEQLWNTTQESFCKVNLPSGYMLLLSALDNGWQILRQELVPSWDQNGFIHLITLQSQVGNNVRQLILPKNTIVEDLINEYSFPG